MRILKVVGTILVGALALVVALSAVFWVVLSVALPGCSELDTKEALSPDGHYIARYVGQGCGGGGALGGIDLWVELRRTGEDSAVKLLEFKGGWVELYWADRRLLIVEYNLSHWDEVVTQRRMWRDVAIRYCDVQAATQCKRPLP